MPIPLVYIVHCIDTEGPLQETVTATFERLKEIYDIDLFPNVENLRKLQKKELDLGGIENAVAKTCAPKMLAYNDSWAKIKSMLDRLLSPDFRSRFLDSFGNSWIYNWFIIDHVGFRINPRNRDLGFNKIWDWYTDYLKAHNMQQDGIHFHHHPVPFSKAANHCATHFFNHTPIIYEILARKIIDHAWFPSVYRPGFNSIRPDSHWFLEQFIPFDYSNQRTEESLEDQIDLAGGRFGDWRRAPLSWVPYHSSHDDYQIPGTCRRWTARCLNIGTRMRLLNEKDVERAFAEAEAGKPVVMSFTNHDFREMEDDIKYVAEMIDQVAKCYPQVKFRWCEAREAMRLALKLKKLPIPKVDQNLTKNHFHISLGHKSFGPQPYLALKTKHGEYLHDNFDIQIPFREWTYTFDEHTIPIENIDTVAWAINDSFGNTLVSRINPRSGNISISRM